MRTSMALAILVGGSVAFNYYYSRKKMKVLQTMNHTLQAKTSTTGLRGVVTRDQWISPDAQAFVSSSTIQPVVVRMGPPYRIRTYSVDSLRLEFDVFLWLCMMRVSFQAVR
jgi:hypothetical protein